MGQSSFVPSAFRVNPTPPNPVIRFELFADIPKVICTKHKKVYPLIYSANTFPLAMGDLELFVPLNGEEGVKGGGRHSSVT